MGIIYFDIAALCIHVLNFYLYFSRSRLYLKQTRVFLFFIVIAVFATLSDIATLGFYANVHAHTRAWHYTINILFYLFQNTIPISFCFFVLALVDEKKAIQKSIKYSLYLPWIVSIILILTTPLTHKVFYFDQNLIYFRGSFLPILYAFALAYTIAGFVIFLFNRMIVSKETQLAVFLFLPISLLSLVIQFFFPNLLVQNLGIAISCLIILLTIQDFNRYTDYGTQLYNRNGFLVQLDLLLKRKEKCTIFIISINTANFIQVVFGPDIFLALEKQIITKLFGAARSDRFAAKIGQGKFILVVSNQNQIDEEKQALLTAFANPWLFQDRLLTISAHLCQVSIPEDTNDIVSLFQAQNELTQVHGQYPINTIIPFNQLKLTKSTRYQEINKKIHEALLYEGFTVVFQPIISRETKKTIAAEALIRFKDSSRGFISPAEFIPIAEQTGKIHEIGNFVIQESCRFLKNLKRNNIPIQFIEINLSPVQCLHPNLPEKILQIVKKHNLMPQELCFEITETAANRSPSIIKTNLDTLAKAGFLIAIDDFGTGYSNITQLTDFPFSIVKFDRSLLEAMSRSENGKLGLQGLVSMFKHINAKLVAEGVETAEQVEQTESMGIDYIQGYHFAKPLNPDAFKDYLTKET